MTAIERARRTRRVLLAGVLVRALGWALCAALLVLVLALGGDWLFGMPRGVRSAVSWLAMSAGIITLVMQLHAGRAAASLEAVALWIEARVPELEYALVTLVTTPAAGASAAPQLERLVAASAWGRPLARAGWRAVRLPLAVGGLLAAALLFAPEPARARVLDPRPDDDLASRRAGASRSALHPIVVTVTPPAYSRLRPSDLTDPVSVRALVGSRLQIRGRGVSVALRAVVDGRALNVTVRGDTWAVVLPMPSRATALRLQEPPRERLLVLEPIPDSAPVLRLSLPTRDTVLRLPEGRIPLLADAQDDFGLATAEFEFIVSSGQGESFEFRSGSVGSVRPGGTAHTRLRAVLSLDSLALKPGDILHLRAVARDGNTIAGAQLGSSETRTLRIARSGEYDSISVEGAPPPEAAKSIISQRMLIVLTEALEKKRPRLTRPALLAESRRISVDQKRLRKRVGALVYTRLGGEEGAEHSRDEGEEGEPLPETPDDLVRRAEEATSSDASRVTDFQEDETPVVAINQPLLEAFNAMWDASRELDIGEPAAALPYMRIALAAIQRARQAERIYLRGRPPAVVVDLARVRLQGKDRGADSRRPASTSVESTVERYATRFSSALDLLASNPAAAIDSLTLLRLDALADAPPLAAALDAAIVALRAERDASTALLIARRALFGAPRQRDSLGAWSAWE